MSIQVPSWYSSTNALYYNPESNIADDPQLWNDFLSSIEDPDILSTVKKDPNTTEVQSLYLNFLQGKLKEIYVSEDVNALSPKEIEARATIFEVYKVIVNMLKVLQECLRQQAGLLQNYTNLQYEWTKMLTQTPVYGPNLQDQIVLDKNDFTKTSLGYSNITIEQVFSSLLSQLEGKNLTTVSWSTPTNYRGVGYIFNLNKNTDGTFTASMGINRISTTALNTTICPTQTFLVATTDALSLSGLSTQGKLDIGIPAITKALSNQWNLCQQTPNGIALTGYPVSNLNVTWAQLAQIWTPTAIAQASFTQSPIFSEAVERSSQKSISQIISDLVNAAKSSGQEQTYDIRDDAYFSSHFGDFLSTPYLELNITPNTDTSTGETRYDFTFSGNNFSYGSSGEIIRLNLTLSYFPSDTDTQTITNEIVTQVNEEWNRNINSGSYIGTDFDWSDMKTIYNDAQGPFGIDLITQTDPRYYYLSRGISGPAAGKVSGAHTSYALTTYGAGAWDEEALGGYSALTDDKAVAARQASQTYRSDINSQLMQYMESAKAYRTRVSNAAQITQNMITQTNDAITAQTDLITSIMQTLSGLIAAIFR